MINDYIVDDIKEMREDSGISNTLAKTSELDNKHKFHGFVHGHIHKHKDHTHIHGHIHSHDPQPHASNECHDNVKKEDLDLNINQDDLKGLPTIEDPSCPLDENHFCEVLCTELDDCYYTNCDDSSGYDEVYPSKERLTGIESEELSSYSGEHNHANNLCLETNDKKLFNEIFNEFQKENNANLNIDNIHYPHEIHPVTNTHKAYFHTNVSEQNLINDFGDYDFHFKFDNSFPNNKVNSLGDSIVGDSRSCKWDNCYSHLENSDLVDHIFANHIGEQSDEFNCEWLNCNNTFNDLDLFLDHLSMHKQEEILKERQLLRMPESGELSSGSIPVDIKVNNDTTRASTKFNISNLKVKKQHATIDSNFTCKWEVGTNGNSESVICGHTHDDAGSLQEHIIKDHIGSGKSSYNCKWVGCERHSGKNFPQRQKLLRHMHIHTNYKPWKCDICNSTFAVESMLTQHLRIHSGEKPFKCSICGKKFATSSSLSIHNRVHTGEKPLCCKFEGCNKRFSESSNLAKHMKTHLKSFQCDECHMNFDKKSNYLKHVASHHQGPKLKYQRLSSDIDI